MEVTIGLHEPEDRQHVLPHPPDLARIGPALPQMLAHLGREWKLPAIWAERPPASVRGPVESRGLARCARNFAGVILMGLRFPEAAHSNGAESVSAGKDMAVSCRR